MSLFHVTPHPVETQLLAGANQTRADFVFDVMPNPNELNTTGHARTIWSLVLDSSGSMAGEKMRALKAAVKQILSHLPEEDNFEIQVIYFHTFARELIEPTRATDILRNLRRAQQRVDDLKAQGTTSMGRGLELALKAFKQRPDAIRRVLLLSDGEQQGDEPISRVYEVAKQIDDTGGQIEAWGIGHEWNANELRRIAELTGGTAEVIPSSRELADDIEALLEDVRGTPAQDVNLIFRTPKMYEILEVKQVYPNILPAQADKISGQEFIIPLGTVTGQGSKILVRIQGVERPAGLAVRAIKPELQYTRNGETVVEELPASANAFVRWVTNASEIQPRDPVVARYRGEEQIVQLQQEGFAALEAGDTNLATARLSAALQAAEETGSLATAQLKALFDPRTGRLRAQAGSAEFKTAKLLSGQTGRLVKTGKLQ
jgi:Mg-chelatase subunit ChlD/nitrite reductase/ring-hydroxylating ferredoxin subunit